MTGNLLPTDIELATKLVAAGRPSEDVIAALNARGVDPTTASQVADDLLHGRKVEPQIPPTLEIAPRRRRSAKGSQPQPAPVPAAPAAGEQLRQRRRSRSPGPRPKFPIVAWLLGAAICGVLAVVAVLLMKDVSRHRAADSEAAKASVVAAGTSRHASESSRTSSPVGERAADVSQTKLSGTGSSGAAKSLVGTNGQLSPARIVLELTADGLRLNGKPVVPGNLLGSVSEILRSPSRRAQAGKSGTGVYAFDKEGLLVYSGQIAGKWSIVLDCEGSGGATGAAAPFTGTLRIEDQVIGVDTDSATLAGMKQLGLTNPATGGGILSGRYRNFELAFAYLKSPQRLSLIEIEMK